MPIRGYAKIPSLLIRYLGAPKMQHCKVVHLLFFSPRISKRLNYRQNYTAKIVFRKLISQHDLKPRGNYVESTGSLYILNSANNSVSVIDTFANNKVIATIPVDYAPVAAAYDNSIKQMFVSNLVLFRCGSHQHCENKLTRYGPFQVIGISGSSWAKEKLFRGIVSWRASKEITYQSSAIIGNRARVAIFCIGLIQTALLSSFKEISSSLADYSLNTGFEFHYRFIRKLAKAGATIVAYSL